MNYYILQQDLRIPGNQRSILECPENIDPLEWINGKTLSDPGYVCCSLSPKSGTFISAIISGPVTLYHHTFIAELIRLGINNIQHFPVELESSEGSIELNYSLINVIGLIEAVATKESVIVEPTTGGQEPLKSFKIDPVKAKGHRLFRLAEAPTLIIIDENLRESILAFAPPEVFMLPTELYDGRIKEANEN